MPQRARARQLREDAYVPSRARRGADDRRRSQFYRQAHLVRGRHTRGDGPAFTGRPRCDRVALLLRLADDLAVATVAAMACRGGEKWKARAGERDTEED